MSNVKINGNNYNDISSVKLLLADGSGYATYNENASVGGEFVEQLMKETFTGYENSEIKGEVNISWLKNVYAPDAEVNIPNATGVYIQSEYIYLKSLKLPKASFIAGDKHKRNALTNGRLANSIIDYVDLSGINSQCAINQIFYNCQIGTLKLGKLPNCNGLFQNAKITNLYWNNPDIPVDKMAGAQGLATSGAVITNAYVPDVYYDEIKALIDAGTLTTVSNLYKISEWSE